MLYPGKNCVNIMGNALFIMIFIETIKALGCKVPYSPDYNQYK